MENSRTSRGAKTLPGEYFTSPEVYQLESQRIFAKQWICVGRSHDAPQPGDFLLHDLDGESLLVVRDEHGEVNGFYNVCRHRGTRLQNGDCGQFKSRIQCPYHAWSYDLQGCLKSAPNMEENAEFHRQDHSLASVRCAEWRGFLFINLDPEAPPLEAALSALLYRFDDWRLGELVAAQRIVYDVEANWKIVFHNYSECYHCSLVHPQLNPVTSVESASNDFFEGPFLGGPMILSDEFQTISTEGQFCGKPFSRLSQEDLRRVYFYTLFPSLFISPHPDYVLTHRIERRGAHSTRIICEWLFPPDVLESPGFEPQGTVDFWDLTNRQDWRVCEQTHSGVQSRAYQPGPYSALESVLAAFDSHYLGLMNDQNSQ